MSAPRATMRLQFHRGFAFADATALVPYFAALGISHVYASPIMTARPGSMHGYDSIDPTRVNPELGGEDALRQFVAALHRHDLGLIVDIVPNHMAIGRGNEWWMDVLARGERSGYAKYFDIDWTPGNPALRGKVLLPILGRPYGEALAAGEIKLHKDSAGRMSIRYFDHVFPLNPDGETTAAPRSIDDFDAKSPDGRERLHALLEAQHYRLAWWRCANDEINWRRFFDINELAAIRIEEEDVFEAVHGTVLRLYAEGLVDGVRVDHVDGLSLPGDYCRKLRRRLRALDQERPPNRSAAPAYFVVEKILAFDERLPTRWETDGTTGYDFMDEISALQHDEAGARPLADLWARISGRPRDFRTEEVQARHEILWRSFAAQFDGTVNSFYDIAQGSPFTRDISKPALRRSLTEIFCHFPVYRIYAGIDRATESDLAFLSHAVAEALRSSLPGDKWLIELLGRWLGGERICPGSDALQALALRQFQQLSAPLSAKAVEDTAFYRYGRLISRNDVGFDPGRLSCRMEEFHRRMAERSKTLPHALLATATHDHKRGEDARARLAVLSEMPQEWGSALERWVALSDESFPRGHGQPTPTPGDRAILFQTIVGAWPLGLKPEQGQGITALAKRIALWQQKALREAKLCTDWSAPDEAHEHAAADLIDWIFFAGSSPLLGELAGFAERIAAAGAVNSLGQLLVKLTAPGVPDIYQGTEFWDFSLVDPDNRAPVDFTVRQQALSAENKPEPSRWADGRFKQMVIARTLALRKQMPQLFADGEYVPLRTDGALAGHVVAFARTLGASSVVTAVCLHPAGLLGDAGTIAIPGERWEDTRVRLPATVRTHSFIDILTDGAIEQTNDAIAAKQLFGRLPVALLLAQGG